MARAEEEADRVEEADLPTEAEAEDPWGEGLERRRVEGVLTFHPSSRPRPSRPPQRRAMPPPPRRRPPSEEERVG